MQYHKRYTQSIILLYSRLRSTCFNMTASLSFFRPGGLFVDRGRRGGAPQVAPAATQSVTYPPVASQAKLQTACSYGASSSTAAAASAMPHAARRWHGQQQPGRRCFVRPAKASSSMTDSSNTNTTSQTQLPCQPAAGRSAHSATNPARSGAAPLPPSPQPSRPEPLAAQALIPTNHTALPSNTSSTPSPAAVEPGTPPVPTQPQHPHLHPDQLLSRRAAGLSLALPAVLSSPLLLPHTLLPSARAAASAPEDVPGASQGAPGGRFSAQPTAPGGQAQPAEQQPRKPRRPLRPVPHVELAPGLRVSKVIRGCWQLSGRHTGDPVSDRTSGSEAVNDLAIFHRAGINTLDTADNYGPSEALIGQYLRLSPWEATTTTVATKVSFVTAEDMATVNRTMVEYRVRNSLARLGRQRLDLVQLQWADPGRSRRWLDVLKWLADMREEGLVGHIGLCNFNVPHMVKAVDSGVGIACNQVQLSLIDRRPLLYLQKAASQYGVKLLAYGTLAGGLLSDRFYEVPAGRVRLDTASKQKYGQVLKALGGPSGGGWSWLQEVLAAARAVAERHGGGVTPSAVAVAWVLQQPQVAAAIVGARNARHVSALQVACTLQLDDTDLLDLDAVWEGVPYAPTSDVYDWERGGDW